MGGKMSRTKGHSFEREMAAAFRQIFPEAIRQLEYQEGLGVDLANTGALRIQCKRGRKYASLSKIEEAYGPTGIPVLVTKGDHKETLVALKLTDFLRILEDPSYVKGTDIPQETRSSESGGHRIAGVGSGSAPTREVG